MGKQSTFANNIRYAMLCYDHGKAYTCTYSYMRRKFNNSLTNPAVHFNPFLV